MSSAKQPALSDAPSLPATLVAQIKPKQINLGNAGEGSALRKNPHALKADA